MGPGSSLLNLLTDKIDLSSPHPSLLRSLFLKLKAKTWLGRNMGWKGASWDGESNTLHLQATIFWLDSLINCPFQPFVHTTATMHCMKAYWKAPCIINRKNKRRSGCCQQGTTSTSVAEKLMTNMLRWCQEENHDSCCRGEKLPLPQPCRYDLGDIFLPKPKSRIWPSLPCNNSIKYIRIPML